MISRIHLRNAISRPACLGARHQAHSSGTTSTCLIAMIGGTKSLASAVEQIPGRTLIEINKKVGFRLLTKAGTTGVFNRAPDGPDRGCANPGDGRRLVLPRCWGLCEVGVSPGGPLSSAGLGHAC